MKTILVALGFISACGCSIGKDIQVEMVQAELIKIDTIQRGPESMQLLTWRDNRDVRYFNYQPISRYFALGTSMVVMKQR